MNIFSPQFIVWWYSEKPCGSFGWWVSGIIALYPKLRAAGSMYCWSWRLSDCVMYFWHLIHHSRRDVLWCPMTFDCFLFVFPLILNLFMKLFVTSPVDLKSNPKLPDCSEVVLTVVVVDYPLLREACRPSSISLVLCTWWCYHT